MRTTRLSALPYWLAPRWIAIGSAPSIGGKGERAEQQRDVVVPLVGDREGHGDLGEEDLLAGRGRVGGDVEPELVRAGREPVRGQVVDAAVVVGPAGAELDHQVGGAVARPLGADPRQPDRYAAGRLAQR